MKHFLLVLFVLLASVESAFAYGPILILNYPGGRMWFPPYYFAYGYGVQLPRYYVAPRVYRPRPTMYYPPTYRR